MTGYPGFSSSAGYIGPDIRIDHDISLLIPEIWARLTPVERQPEYLLKHGYLEPVEDFEHKGQMVLASRLGYRITSHFVHGLMGKIFDNPYAVFTEEILQPERQNLEVFVDGVNNIVETQQRVAQQYIVDGSIEDACPPLYALLHIMADGHYQGMDAHHPQIRSMFTRDYLLHSEWYLERLEIKQQRDIALWQRHVDCLDKLLHDNNHRSLIVEMKLEQRLEQAKQKLAKLQGTEYIQSLVGTLGADPLGPYRSARS